MSGDSRKGPGLAARIALVAFVFLLAVIIHHASHGCATIPGTPYCK